MRSLYLKDIAGKRIALLYMKATDNMFSGQQ